MEVQYSTAGHQDVELRTAGQQVRKSCCLCQHLLEIVEQQQQALVSYIALQKIRYWLLSSLFDAERLGDGRNDQVGIANGSQRDEAHAVRKVIEQVCRYL